MWKTYFWHLCEIVRSRYVPEPDCYSRLLWKLHNTRFSSNQLMYANRIGDAFAYRRRNQFDDLVEPVGILEIMVSLADRIETDIMGGTVDRNRTAEWFWEMLRSLGLYGMDNEHYDESFVRKVVSDFIHQRYSANGEGGLFTVSTPGVNMPQYELWYQANLHIAEVLKVEGFFET